MASGSIIEDKEIIGSLLDRPVLQMSTNCLKYMCGRGRPVRQMMLQPYQLIYDLDEAKAFQERLLWLEKRA